MTANVARFAAGLFRDRRASLGYRLLGQIGLVGLMIGIVLSGFFFTNSHQQALLDLREGGRQMRIAQEALMDAEAYVLNKAIGDRDSDVSLFNRAFEALQSRRESQRARLDPHLRTANGASTSAHDILTALEVTWTEALDIARAGRFVEAQALLNERRTAAQVGRMRRAFEAFLADWNSRFAIHETRIEISKVIVLASQLLIGATMIFAFGSGARDAQARSIAIAEMQASRAQVSQLFEMTDMLQSASDHHDANAVLRATAGGLVAGFGGALYFFNNSRDRLILSTS